MLFQVGSR